MLSKIFVEYSIHEADVEAYKAWIRGKMPMYPELEVLESDTQNGLFVEIWSGERTDDWIRRRRDAADAEWGGLLAWTRGGAEKLHCWRFRPL